MKLCLKYSTLLFGHGQKTLRECKRPPGAILNVVERHISFEMSDCEIHTGELLQLVENFQFSGFDLEL